MESRDAYRSELIDELENEFGYLNALELEVEKLRAQVTELRSGVCTKQHGAARTFDCSGDLPCPQCGSNKLLFGFNYTDEDDNMQHTLYICRNWPLGGARCGWQGGSVPGWDRR